MGKSTGREKRKLVANKPVTSGSDNSPFNAEQYHAYLQSLAPDLEITPADIERYKAFFLIRDFVSNFAFDEGRAVAFVIPTKTELKALAERFRRYLEQTVSLDEAFGLQGPTGRRSPREKVRIRNRRIQARALYQELRSKKLAIKKAVSEVARVLNCAESTAHSLIFRKRSDRRS